MLRKGKLGSPASATLQGRAKYKRKLLVSGLSCGKAKYVFSRQAIEHIYRVSGGS